MMQKNRLTIVIVSLVLLTGCFNKPHPMRPTDLLRIDAPAARLSIGAGVTGEGVSACVPKPGAREWLKLAQEQLGRVLPPSLPGALLTDDLVKPDGRPVDVFGHFLIAPAHLRHLLPNFLGFLNTIEGSASSFAVDQEAPVWPGFETVWIPVQDGVELCARLGLARDGDHVRDSACVILLPGFFGDNSVMRTHEIADALVASGIHALALEVRGHGQVEKRFPHNGYTFGVIESGDLLLVDEWLRRMPGISSSGLLGFCWGGNTALLAAWLDGRPDNDPSIGDRVRQFVPPRSSERHFTAGVLAFSPVLHFEEAIDDCDTWKSPGIDPCIYALQDVIRWRMLYKGWGRPHYSLRRLIDHEFGNSDLGMDQATWRDALRFLRFMPYKNRPPGEKLERARVPVLLVHGANDPFIPSQLIANYMAGISNRNVAAVVLPGGGHIGFAPYSRSYYYSLMINFFDPRTGPGGQPVAINVADENEPSRSMRSISRTAGR